MKKALQKISEEISLSGSISFERFMDLALYCPECGYYEKIEDRIGRRGDFFTGVSVGPLFGALLAAQFVEWHRDLGGIPLVLVEAGAHDGTLARDILRFLQAHHPELSQEANYWILEPSSARRGYQQARLGELGSLVRWVADLTALTDRFPGGVTGILFGNEFLDALPFRRWRWDSRRRVWVEVGVGLREGELRWIELGQQVCAFEELFPGLGKEKGVAELRAAIPEGFIYDQSTVATAWWGRAAAGLARGWLCAIDYGYMSEEFFSRGTRNGTLRGYRKHQAIEDVLGNAGEQDITGHVNFTEIVEAGQEHGLTTAVFETQGRFLTRILARVLRKEVPFEAWDPEFNGQFQTLTHPAQLGERFRVVAQQKG